MSKTPSLKKFSGRHRRYLVALQNSIELVKNRVRSKMGERYETPIATPLVPQSSQFLQTPERSLMQGLYVCLALLLTSLVCAAGFGLYLVLDPFLRPLMWALLSGAVLFPFKFLLTASADRWFTEANRSPKPFALSLAITPLKEFDRFAESLGSLTIKYGSYFAFAILMIGALQGMNNLTPDNTSQLIGAFSRIDLAVQMFISTCNDLMVRSAMVLYLSVLCFFWTPATKVQFRYGSIVIWPFLSAYIANILGSIWSPRLVFYGLQILFLVGLINRAVLVLNHDKISGEKKKSSMIRALKLAVFSSTQYPPSWKREESEESISLNESIKLKRKRSTRNESDVKSAKLTSQGAQELRREQDVDNPISDSKSKKFETDKYLYGAFYACVGVTLWKHSSILAILVIPMAYYCLKRIVLFSGVGEMIENLSGKVSKTIFVWYLERRSALIPMPIRSLYEIGAMVEQKVAKTLRKSIHTVSTTLVICALILLVMLTSIFFTFQIYAEGMYLIQISVEYLNSALMNSPENDWVSQEWKDYMIGTLESAYLYGRTAISDCIRRFLKDLEPAQADHLEMKLVSLWDELYQTWVSSEDQSDFVEPSANMSTAVSVWNSLRNSFEMSSLDLLSLTSVQNFIGENIGVFMSILDSVYGMAKGYMALILSMVTELAIIVFMSGSFLLNFSVNTVVFFTTLFYLLNASRNVYKPIEVISNFSPVKCDKFVVAMQESVIEVFTTTFKLASFFGMWTWFVHNLFQVKIVYLPSFFATMLGAVPFLDAYFACIPAAIELWLSQGLLVALTFFLLHFLPCSIVVSEFHEEIEGGGHAYLTGLSIAGGIFCFGFEGAIFGPLMLCCVLMAINLSKKCFRTPLVG